MLNIKIIILLSGQQIIGKVINETATKLTLEAPAVLMMSGDSPEKMSLGLAPFCPYSADKVVEFNLGTISATVEPAESLANEYNRIFGNGLVTAKSQLII
jgi:hypothetical protein